MYSCFAVELHAACIGDVLLRKLNQVCLKLDQRTIKINQENSYNLISSCKNYYLKQFTHFLQKLSCMGSHFEIYVWQKTDELLNCWLTTILFLEQNTNFIYYFCL